MTRSMKLGKIIRQLGREARTAIRLSPVALVALLLVIALWRSDSAANSGLFQSSPVETPTSTATIPTVEVTLTIVPTTPPIQLTPTVPGGQETATTMPPGPGTPTTEATLPVLTETPTMLPIETVTVDPGTLTPTPTSVTATPSPTAEAEATPDDRARYPEGDSNLQFEWGMLFDSVSLLLSYVWLCCGVLIFVAVPVVFIVLWVASKQRQQPEEEE